MKLDNTKQYAIEYTSEKGYIEIVNITEHDTSELPMNSDGFYGKRPQISDYAHSKFANPLDSESYRDVFRQTIYVDMSTFSKVKKSYNGTGMHKVFKAISEFRPRQNRFKHV